MSNTRLYQIAFKKEAQPAVLASSLLVAANARVEFKDPQFTINKESYEREVVGANLSPGQAIGGKVSCQISFAVEMAGSTETTATPPWGPLLEACGFRTGAVYGGTWNGTFGGTATGTAKHFYTGQLVQTASAAKTARVVHDVYEGQTAVYLEPVVGTLASSDVFFPATSDATVGPTLTLTGGQPGTAKGHYWVPTSSAISTATAASTSGTISAGDILQGATSGATVQALAAVTDGTLRQFRILDGTPTAGGETFNNKSQTGSSALSTWDQLEFPSLSIALIQDGRVKIAKGCRGTVSFSGEPGQPVFMNFQFTGLLASVPDGGQILDVVRVSKVPPKVQGIGCLVGSFDSGEPGYFSHATAHTPKLRGFTFDMGGSVAVESDATQASGSTGAANQTQRRAGQGNLKVGHRPEASFPFEGKLADDEPIWIKMRFAGNASNANNAFLISTPGATISGGSDGESDGYGESDLSLRLASRTPTGGDGQNGELVLSYHYSSSTAW